MTAQVFHHLLDHLANARFNFGTDDVTIAPITDDLAAGINTSANAYSIQTAEFRDDWTSHIETGEVMTSPVTVELTSGGLYKVKIESLDFDVASDLDTYGLLFYKDTGTPATSPLISVELFDEMVTIETGVGYGWTAPSNGIFRLVANS